MAPSGGDKKRRQSQDLTGSGFPRLAPTAVVVALLALIIAGVIWLISTQTLPTPSHVPDLGGPIVETAAVPGDPGHFDPIASYEQVHQFAGADLDLGYLLIDYVRADGTLDLTAPYDPRVQYRFFRELSTPPPSAPPVGVQGVTEQPWDDMNEILIQPRRMLSSRGNVQGLKRLPAPICSMKTLWGVAIARGAPKDAVASVFYDSTGYHFRIENTRFDMDFDPTCKLMADTSASPTPPDQR